LRDYLISQYRNDMQRHFPGFQSAHLHFVHNFSIVVYLHSLCSCSKRESWRSVQFCSSQ